MERKIRIEDAAIYRDDYQLRMIHLNEPKGLLPVSCYTQDDRTFFDYDVTGKSSVKAIYEKSEIGWKDLMALVEQLVMTLREAEKYLLNIHHILLKPEYIFCENENYYFCYCPVAKQDIWEEFQELTRFFVKKADYQDELCTKLVCILNNGAMEENYSIDHLMAECMAEKKKMQERDSLYVMKSSLKQEDMFCEADNYQAQDFEPEEEKPSFWEKIFGRKKNTKWGDWENL